MLVIAIVALLAAVGVSTLGPSIDTAKLEGGAEALASFVAQAQQEAMTSKRCVRITLPTNKKAVAERLNSFDCDDEPSTALIDASAGPWVEFATFTPDNSAVLSIELDPVPSETTAAALGGTEVDQIRFRPSGRLFSSDDDITDDDGVIKITHTGMSGSGNFKKILVEAQGFICDINRGTNPAGSGNNLSCP